MSLGFFSKLSHRSRSCSATRWALCLPKNSRPKASRVRWSSYAPAPRAGIPPQTDGEKQLGQDLMGLGVFWKTVINPDFDLARVLSLNCIPDAEQRAVFDKFGPESGRAFFELFFWMFDATGASAVNTSRQLSGAVRRGRRRQDGVAGDCARDHGGIFRGDFLGASRSRPYAGAGAWRRRNRAPHRLVAANLDGRNFGDFCKRQLFAGFEQSQRA